MSSSVTNGVAGEYTTTTINAAAAAGVDKGVDFANYFCTYAFLYHQKEMLCDRVRMDAYYNAVFQNKHHFNGKVHHDMTAPLQHYFIYTGHNSYLTGNQLSSVCSTLPIIKALQRGVRVIELDLWPNSTRDDIHVLHGRITPFGEPPTPRAAHVATAVGTMVVIQTVLDVGTGSGILAIWAGQAGARKVYAVEATKMSEHARALVKANNLQGVVEVIEGSIEDITLPEKVDVIISEWMGYFLLRESMFDSVICARDRWLKPTGSMYPSHARMWLAPIRSGLGDQKMNDYEGSMDDWFYFLDETKTYYGVDMSALTKPFSEEQKKYYLQTSLWNNLHPNQLIGSAAMIKEIDCSTATVNDILDVRASMSSLITTEETRLCGFAGWFDVHFRGSKENPAQHEIELTTAPSEDYSTHWGQQVFLLHPSIHVSEGDNLAINFSMTRSKENHRLMEVELSCEIKQPSSRLLPPFRKKFYIE